MNGSDYLDLWYQLRETKALLIAVLVAMGFIVVIFGLLARSFAKANRAVRINLEARAFQVEASALLDQGSYVESKRYFSELAQLDPRYKKVTETHLAQIEEALRQSKPKLV